MAEASLQEMARQVIELCGPRRMSDVCADLEKTQSIEATVNRIFDGTFLEGTSRDPSLQVHVILDSDDEAAETRSPAAPAQELSQNTSTSAAPISLLSSSPEPSGLMSSPDPCMIENPNAISSRRSQAVDSSHTESDNDSLPSLDELMDRIASARKNTDNMPFNSQPLPSRDNDIVNLLEDDEDDDTVGKRPKKAIRTSRQKRKRRDDDNILFSRYRPTSSSLPVEYLQQWESSDDQEEESEDASQSVAHTPKDKKERLRKEKQAARQRKAEEKKREQEEKRRKKQEEKAAKEAEKQRKKLIEQANKLRTDRSDLKDMILDVHREFASSARGEMLQSIVESKEATFNVVTRNRPYTVAWRRKHWAEWNQEEARFVPYEDNQPRIKDERHVLIFMEADELCELIQSNRLDAKIDEIKNATAGGGDKQIMLMVEGLDTYYKRKQLLQQRQFEKAVLQNIGQSSATEQASSSRSKRRGKTDKLAAAVETGPEKHVIEETLTYLQMIRDVMLVPTTDANDSVEWILSMTADLAGSLQKRLQIMNKHYHSSAYTATDPSDAWMKMLQEIHLCTSSVAKAVLRAYPTVQSLHQTYERSSDPENTLANLQVERSVVSSRDRTINRVMSKRIYTVFSSDDPNQVLS